MKAQPVILFDGVCNFCDAVVQFVLKRDKKQQIKFAALQSEAGRMLKQQYGLPEDDLRSFLFIENGKLYRRSAAALRMCRYLKGLWPLLYGCMLVPSFIRDGVYDWVAKNRYKWFGKKNECMVPGPEMKARFL